MYLDNIVCGFYDLDTGICSENGDKCIQETSGERRKCFENVLDDVADELMGTDELKKSNVVDDVDFIGYVTFYIYFAFDNETATICKTSFDFTKPITQEFVNSLVESISDIYEKSEGVNVCEYKFVTEEAYKLFVEKYGDDGIVANFDEETLTVKRVKNDY